MSEYTFFTWFDLATICISMSANNILKKHRLNKRKNSETISMKQSNIVGVGLTSEASPHIRFKKIESIMLFDFVS